MLAFELAHQTLLDGFTYGLGYGLLAVGFVLLYRSSRVINLAYAEVGVFASSVLLVLVATYGWNYWLGLAVALIVGAALGGIIEMLVMRRLARAPKVVAFVATAGVAQVLLAAQIALPPVPNVVKRFPTPWQWSGSLGDAAIRSDHLIALVVAPIVVAGLAWFLKRSIWGLAIRGAATNSDGAKLAGVPAGVLVTLVWTIGGVLATVTQLITRPLIGVGTSAGVSLNTQTLVIALAASTIARLRSLPVAMCAGIGLGLTQRALLVNYSSSPGIFDLLLGAVIVTAILSWRRSDNTEDGLEWMFVPDATAGAARGPWWVRRSGLLGYSALSICAVLLPFVVTESARQFTFTRIVIFALVAISVTILTGWGGQLSLGQFAFAGTAAFVAMRMAGDGLGFFPAAGIGVAAAVVTAMAVGLPALRVRGLLLAVITLAFALLASSDLYKRILGDDNGRLQRSGTSPIDLGPQRTYYWFCLAVLALVIIVATRLRRRGPGRALIAMRSNEANASAYGVWPTKQKLAAFALAGGLAGLGGVLLAANAPATVSYNTENFIPVVSIDVVAIAVVGGLTSVHGAVLGALWVVGLPAFFPDAPAAPLLAGGIGLLVVLMYFPGGLGHIATTVQGMIIERFGSPDDGTNERLGANSVPGDQRDDSKRDNSIRDRATFDATPSEDSDGPALETVEVSVSFGGIQAVRDVSIQVAPGEVVGLIGANGAGKSTLMNAIGGYIPMTGRVLLHGTDIGNWSAARRSSHGLGRAFQNATMFPEMPVREVIAVSLERSMPSSWALTLSGLPSGARTERAQRARAAELVDLVGLGRYANHRIGELSTGTRRIVELACLIGHGGSVICLDEPTAGVAQKETEAFGPLLLDIRRQLDAAMLVIEHDMGLIMSLSNRIYCMEAGRIISEGEPDQVRNDPAVIASYLGTDKAAIERSGTIP